MRWFYWHVDIHFAICSWLKDTRERPVDWRQITSGLYDLSRKCAFYSMQISKEKLSCPMFILQRWWSVSWSWFSHIPFFNCSAKSPPGSEHMCSVWTGKCNVFVRMGFLGLRRFSVQRIRWLISSPHCDLPSCVCASDFILLPRVAAISASYSTISRCVVFSRSRPL